jgi:hypothetical protein
LATTFNYENRTTETFCGAGALFIWKCISNGSGSIATHFAAGGFAGGTDGDKWTAGFTGLTFHDTGMSGLRICVWKLEK